MFENSKSLSFISIVRYDGSGITWDLSSDETGIDVNTIASAIFPDVND
jgi:hypothetical protein